MSKMMTPAEIKPTRSAAEPASAGKHLAVTVRLDTPDASVRLYSARSMEILLLLWDEMDDAPRVALLDQLRYYAELHAFYARRR